MSKEILELKIQHEWLKTIPSQVPQQVGRQLDQALKSTFNHGRGFPKFKRKREGFGSYYIPQVNNHIRVEDNHVKLPKLGLVKIKLHRELPSEIKSATVIQDMDRFYVSFLVEVIQEEKIREISKTNAVGVDLGLSRFITLSTGEKVDNLKPFRKKQRRLRLRQRKLSRAKSNSQNRRKQRQRVYRLHRTIREQRQDFHHKMANHLLDRFDLICIEDLSVKGLMRTKLAKSIADSGWASFTQILQYKTELRGKCLVQIGRFDPSSKTCNSCGSKQPMPLSQRIYECESCGHQDDRDVNAARNILDWGYQKYTAGTAEIYASQTTPRKTRKAEAPRAGCGEEIKNL